VAKRKPARVIAVANQKGGVGKSTTAVSLGASLAELGHRVLVVDLDPQGNASTGLGIRHEARDVTVYDVLAAEAAIEGAIVPTPVENLFAIPSTIDLAGAEIELVSQFSRELRLRKALEPLKVDAYAYILLDCPPSLGLLTVNALAAAEELIVPIQCEYYALEGLGQLLRNVRLVQQNVNPGLRLTGIVMTMYDPRTKLSEQVVQEVRRYFGDRVYNTIIPRTVRLSEAPGFGQPITVYDPRSRGAQCYRELAVEVVEKLPGPEPLPVIDELPTVVVPPPEPEAARAPRPLLRDDEPSGDPEPEPPVEDEPSLAERAAPTTEAASAPSAGERNGHADVEGFAHGAGDTMSLGSGAVVDPGRDVEADIASAPPFDAGADALEPDPRPEVEVVELDGPAGDRPEPSTATTAIPAPRHEPGHVITIDEDDARDAAAPMPQPEEETDTAPRRRFGLFRRGGDR